MSEWIVIEYRRYWDIPREFVVPHGDEAYFFESPFDESLDDYAPNFRVYRLPRAAAQIPANRWDEFSWIGERLPDVPVDQLRFCAEPIPGHPLGRNLHFIHESVFDVLQKTRKES